MIRVNEKNLDNICKIFERASCSYIIIRKKDNKRTPIELITRSAFDEGLINILKIGLNQYESLQSRSLSKYITEQDIFKKDIFCTDNFMDIFKIVNSTFMDEFLMVNIYDNPDYTSFNLDRIDRSLRGMSGVKR